MIIPCTKCGGDAPKYKRKKLRRTGKRTKSIASFCIICHSEDQKIREARRYEKKLVYNREWKKKNRKKVNGYERKRYKKHKYTGLLESQEVAWHGITRSDGFSALTYTPLKVYGGW